ncbi:hypothetical protein [uncultured Sphingomonas sp.]|uniref:hypothetical protein n=2 Tax=uncultured Sphingomonas sp. TaxID=158754 RepID=UPI0025FE9F78|nr:hypothetical protein [uncultured Sphingomonas sp.]
MALCDEPTNLSVDVGVSVGNAANSRRQSGRSATEIFAWEQYMKKVLIVAAAAGLMSLAACNSKQAEMNEANAEAVADNIEAQADNLEAMADNATNESTEAMLENAADNMHAKADAAEANADNETDVK